MSGAVENLILDLLEWIGSRERIYEETMAAWRTSCPRLPVWEDALDRELIAVEDMGERWMVRVTAEGLELLRYRRPGGGWCRELEVRGIIRQCGAGW
jgi:hypothetical protein